MLEVVVLLGLLMIALAIVRHAVRGRLRPPGDAAGVRDTRVPPVPVRSPGDARAVPSDTAEPGPVGTARPCDIARDARDTAVGPRVRQTQTSPSEMSPPAVVPSAVSRSEAPPSAVLASPPAAVRATAAPPMPSPGRISRAAMRHNAGSRFRGAGSPGRAPAAGRAQAWDPAA
ncbi:hypothetical protein [Mangrovihabitans endophyticus]|uniref:hypothetical protein n=1 Tax=Mangrovihabitans endophyticus TaxID=1751298 RepID=UPI00166D90F1|nr:hypothetical protein [Mangrovihabitans endophyticus]